MERYYRVLVAETKGGLAAAADDWTVLENTVKAFRGLETATDVPMQNAGAVGTDRSGWIGLSYKDA